MSQFFGKYNAATNVYWSETFNLIAISVDDGDKAIRNYHDVKTALLIAEEIIRLCKAKIDMQKTEVTT